MSEESWKLEKFLCRCCLNEGAHKNLAVPFKTPEGEEEIYSEMLIESININLTPVPGPMCSSTYSICEECILRLRDAFSFKQQVLLSEKRFQDLYNNRNITQSNSSGLDVKLEVPSDNEDSVKLEMDEDNFRLSYDDDGGGGDTKSDGEQESIEERKPRGRKTKAKDKDGQKSRKRARKPKDDAATNEKKDVMDGQTDGSLYTVKMDAAGRRYSCNECGTVYKSLTWVLRHLQDCHAKVAKKACKEVQLVERIQVEILNDQALTIEDISKRTCRVCQKVIKNSRSMPKHLLTHGPFKCSECPSQFTSGNELNLHKRVCHRHDCEVCKKTTYCRNRMILHLRTHGIYKCSHCSETFSLKLELTAHVKTAHHLTRTYQNMTYTIVEDGPKQNFICHECKAIRPSIHSIKYHIRRHSVPKTVRLKIENKFICDHCNKVSHFKWKMVKHIRMWHTPMSCAECGLVCANTSELGSHRRASHPQTMPTCGICGFKCFEKSLLLIHQRRVHMGEKNVACPQCDAKFFDRRMLHKHLVRHNPVKKFECRFCKKKYPRKHTLDVHEKIHLGKKNKVCTICDARFVQKSSLSYHMRKYHPESL